MVTWLLKPLEYTNLHYLLFTIGLLIFITAEPVGLAARSNSDIPLLGAVSLDFSMEYGLSLQG